MDIEFYLPSENLYGLILKNKLPLLDLTMNYLNVMQKNSNISLNLLPLKSKEIIILNYQLDKDILKLICTYGKPMI